MDAGVGWELAEGCAIDGARGWLCVEVPLAAVPFVLWPFAWRLRTSLSGLATEFTQLIEVEIPTCGKIACGRRYTRKVFPWCLKMYILAMRGPVGSQDSRDRSWRLKCSVFLKRRSQMLHFRMTMVDSREGEEQVRSDWAYGDGCISRREEPGDTWRQHRLEGRS